MKWLIQILAKWLGFRFAPDNHVVPVLRLERYHRVEGSGIFWIVPLLERTLPPVKTSLHVGNFQFGDVLSKDNIPFRVDMTILFTFDPNTAHKNAIAVLVRGGEELFRVIIKDYTKQGLRRLVSKYAAEELGGWQAMQGIERTLTDFLTAEMRALGIAPLKSGGVLIKETVAHEKFKLGVLEAERFATMLQALTRYHPVHHLIPSAIWASFVTGLEEQNSNLMFLSPYGMYPTFHSNGQQPSLWSGQNGKNTT